MIGVVKVSTFLVVVALLAAVGASAPVHAKSSGELAEASKEMAEKYEACRQDANKQNLHMLARQRFLRACHKAK